MKQNLKTIEIPRPLIIGTLTLIWYQYAHDKCFPEFPGRMIEQSRVLDELAEVADAVIQQPLVAYHAKEAALAKRNKMAKWEDDLLSILHDIIETNYADIGDHHHIVGAWAFDMSVLYWEEQLEL